jgi:glycosyltransferase involved in cell wall biosynthesis
MLPFLDIPQKKYLLKRTKVFIYLSKGEGLSMSILDSLQSKVPVVCTNECNFPEINKYKCGFTSASNKNILAKNVLSLITSSKKYMTAKTNTQAVVKLFEKERVARLWKKHFLS